MSDPAMTKDDSQPEPQFLHSEEIKDGILRVNIYFQKYINIYFKKYIYMLICNRKH